MQRRAIVVETPRDRKVRRPYAVCTQYILHDTPFNLFILFIQYFNKINEWRIVDYVLRTNGVRIASDTLWIRKVRYRYTVTTIHTPHVRDRLIYHVAVAYQAIKLRSYYVHAALHMFLLG